MSSNKSDNTEEKTQEMFNRSLRIVEAWLASLPSNAPMYYPPVRPKIDRKRKASHVEQITATCRGSRYVPPRTLRRRQLSKTLERRAEMQPEDELLHPIILYFFIVMSYFMTTILLTMYFLEQ